MPDIKRADDYVKLTNIDDKMVTFTYGGARYDINPNTFESVHRHIAELAIKQVTVNGRSSLAIVEYPESLRQKPVGTVPELASEVSALKRENEKLKAENEDLKNKLKRR